jgi:fatty-acyl-CoA synthase/long-chain acyl-CoA synthetase
MGFFDTWSEVSPVGDLLVRGASLHADRDLIVFPESRRSYGEVLDGAVAIARGLLAIGVGPGDHIGLLTINNSEYVEAFFGIELLGCVAVPLNARYRIAELAYIIDNARIKALLTTADPVGYLDYSAVVAEALPSIAAARDPVCLAIPEAPALRSAVVLRGPARPGFLSRDAFHDLAQQIGIAAVDAARRGVRIRSHAAILYTSGTTANPKGCILSHEAMTRGCVERARGRLKSAEHSVTWGSGPLSHIGSLAPFIGTVGAVGTYLTDAFFEPGRALRLMMEQGVTAAWPWFPAIVQGLLDHPSFDPARLDRLRTVLVIAPPALMEWLHALLPKVELLQACGMTETAGIFAISGSGDTAAQRIHSHGRAAPGVELRIIDPDSGRDLPPDTVGEILVRGHCVMEGYYRDVAKSAAALDVDGWLHTGDLYKRDADGMLSFNGRLKDMLKVGGENVAAIEVEAFLAQHPAVKIAEIVGLPDPRLDEVPVAFVELRPGTHATGEELIEFCKGRIASYKVPRAVHFVAQADWPMSATKVNKRELRVWARTRKANTK